MGEKSYVIDSGPPVARGVKVGPWSFNRREIVLAGVALLLLILCLVFIVLYANKDDEKTVLVSASTDKSYCTDQSCLQAASRTLELMDTSVDPCEDFYQYACGNYHMVKTLPYYEGERNVLKDITFYNDQKLMDILKKPIDRIHDTSSERKLKEFYQSCTDTYSRNKLGGRPFLEKVVPTLGGWDLLGTWNESTWDFQQALNRVQGDFWTQAFYDFNVRVDEEDSTRYDVRLFPTGTGKRGEWNYYISSHQKDKFQTAYKNFIRKVTSSLMADAQVAIDQVKLDQFVEDVVTVEINKINLQTQFDLRKLSLDELNAQTNNVFDWVDHLSYVFQEASITGSTQVVASPLDYLKKMTAMIANLPAAHRNRMLHHYLIWKVAEVHMEEMSCEYFEAKNEIYYDLWYLTPHHDKYEYCFSEVAKYMPDALGALFIADHLVDTNRQQVKDITEHLKAVLKEQIQQTSWMDTQTKDYAQEKLDATSFKMGYPDWMADHEMVDSLYDGLTVNVSDFFGNILSANGFLRSTWSRELVQGEDREKWTVPIYDTEIANTFVWNEIIAPAGLLQTPIYDYTQPHYKTFGSLGGLLGRYLYRVIDGHGKDYNKDGNYGDSWWSNKSTHDYESITQCMADVYHQAAEDDKHPTDISGLYYARPSISVINGIRLALRGYRKWAADGDAMGEKMLPGMFDGVTTRDQMVFLSYAQGACYKAKVYPPDVVVSNLKESLHVNVALGQLPEFSEAFGCKKTSRMNAAKKCQ